MDDVSSNAANGCCGCDTVRADDSACLDNTGTVALLLGQLQASGNYDTKDTYCDKAILQQSNNTAMIQ